jgi:cell division protein FtsL
MSRQKKYSNLVGGFIIMLVIYLLYILLPVALVLLAVFIIYKLYEFIYFRGKKFDELKMSVDSYIKECNELNQHIESLKVSQTISHKKDYGIANIEDMSKYKYRRKELDKFSNSKHVYNCSLNICRNAQEKPFQYICKYFNIDKNEESLEYFENLLNNFLAVEDGKKYLVQKRESLISNNADKIPKLIKKFSKEKLEKKLGLETIDFSDLYFPKYTMQYISPGGNSSMKTEVVFDIDNLERFINYLAEHIKWKKSIEGQRALMTPKLREYIKNRDNHTCCSCHNSIENEPNLLLEIDHILPLSKGGMTEESNLQTLCWKCNRAKGAKILDSVS